MMNRPRPIKVAIDMDGVMANFIDHYNAMPGTETQRWDHIFCVPGFWLQLNPLVSTRDVQEINRLSTQTDLWFVTARPTKWARAETEEWLRRVGVIDASVVTTGATREKPRLLEAMKIHAVLDDQIEAIHEAKVDMVRLIPHDYNVGYPLSAYVPSVAAFVQQVREKYKL